MPNLGLSFRVLVLGSLLACAAAGEPKGVDVSLRVKWPGTSSLLEAAEYLVGITLTQPLVARVNTGMWAPANSCVLLVLRQLRAQVPSGPLLKPGRVHLICKRAAGMQSFPVHSSMCPAMWRYPCSRQWHHANTLPRSRCFAI